jgi:hypothetical protein
VIKMIFLLLGWMAGASMAFSATAESFFWYDRASWFGGFSAIEVTDDGRGFVALSDRGRIVEGQFVRDPAGRILDMVVDRHDALRDAAGRPLGGAMDDGEGLAIGPDGRIYVSFEGVARVRVERAAGAPPVDLPRHPAFDAFEANRSFEALAVTPQGAVLVIPEDVPGGGDSPVWRFDGTGWDIAFHVPKDGSYQPVGADVGPDGLLYLLEREVTGLGFRSRVRVFGLNGDGGAVIYESRAGQHDNLEGISVWSDGGAIVMTMIADDNFRFFQRTEVVELRLPQSAGGAMSD